MKIDKSKLTESERAFLESIEKRYGTEKGLENRKHHQQELQRRGLLSPRKRQ